MTSNLPDDLKVNWLDNEIVMPLDVNTWSSAINQIKKIIPSYSSNGNFYTATFSNNVYSLTPITTDSKSNNTPTAYIDGMSVIFKCPSSNTSTCSVNVNGLGNKQIKNLDGSNITSGGLTVGNYIQLIYDNSQGYFRYIDSALTKHINNTSNPHNVTKTQVGLGNCDNTSDANKPISTATQAALNTKANDSEVVKLTGNQTIAGTKTFSSSPIVPTPADGDNSTKSATTAFVIHEIKKTLKNIGEIVASTIPLTDAGLHLLDGALIDETGIYADFVDYIASIYDASSNYFCSENDWQDSVTNYGVCGKFVYNSTNNTVRLPKITGFVEGGEETTLGNLTEAGLPNITGRIDLQNQYFGSPVINGAFSVISSSESNNSGDGGSRSRLKKVDFEASRSSSIYGNSNTVQPQSIKVLYYIVVATTAKTEIEVDIDEIATDLNGKADVDLTNTNNQAKILMSGMSMPSNTYVDLTLGASESTYTAPANGYVYLAKASTAANQWFNIYDNQNEISVAYNAHASGQVMKGYLPILKNHSFTVAYNLAGATENFRFIYAKGSESEAQ